MSPAGEREIVFLERRQVVLRPVARPAGPFHEDQVEGRTVVSLLSVGTELAMLDGLFEYPFPLEPGYAAIFEVERVGDAVTAVATGDLAFTMGPHRSYQRAAESDVLRVPEALAPETAAFCRMVSVSWAALTATAARPPERVWVLGLGLVGHLAARLFAAAGYAVLAYDPRAERLDALSSVDGVTLAADVEDALGAEGGRVALVVECSGSTESVVNACSAVRPGGEVILVGGPWRRESEVDAAAIHRAVYRNYVVLRSGWEWQLPTPRSEDGRPSMLGNMEAALDWLARGRIAIPDGTFALSPPDAAVYDQWLVGEAPGLTTIFDWRATQ